MKLKYIWAFDVLSATDFYTHEGVMRFVEAVMILLPEYTRAQILEMDLEKLPPLLTPRLEEIATQANERGLAIDQQAAVSAVEKFLEESDHDRTNEQGL